MTDQRTPAAGPSPDSAPNLSGSAPERRETDVVVIGGGAVGENAADRVAQSGLAVVLVESALIGGECSYWACMPSKALLRPGTALKGAASVAGSRQAVTGTLDVQAVLERRNSFTSHWDDSKQEAWVRESGIGLLRGQALLTGPREVAVQLPDGGSVLLSARHAVVLATGSEPTPPPLEGLADVDYWGTREATSAQEIPQRLIVLGGGVAGTELAQAYARLGSSVTLVARSGLLGMYPGPARELVEAGLAGDGVEVRTHTGTAFVRSDGSGGVVLGLDDGTTLSADRLLVATGRAPALRGLGLEALGLAGAGRPRLKSDDTGLVHGTDWLYAVGDAAGKVMLTHQGKYEARAAGAAIAARAAGGLPSGAGNDAAGTDAAGADGIAADGAVPAPWSRYTATADHTAVPQVVFTDPEIAMVGRTLEQALEDGVKATETSLKISVAGSALHSDGYDGWAQMVVDEDRGVLVGVTFAGPDVAELLHAATIAVAGEVPLDRLWHAVPAYPTISEVWLRLLEKYGL